MNHKAEVSLAMGHGTHDLREQHLFEPGWLSEIETQQQPGSGKFSRRRHQAAVETSQSGPSPSHDQWPTPAAQGRTCMEQTVRVPDHAQSHEAELCYLQFFRQRRLVKGLDIGHNRIENQG